MRLREIVAPLTTLPNRFICRMRRSRSDVSEVRIELGRGPGSDREQDDPAIAPARCRVDEPMRPSTESVLQLGLWNAST
jgi:hypothetical protein